MTDVTVYGFSASTFVRTARLALEEKGVDYVLEPHMPHDDVMRALHPFGKIPAFRHGDLVLFETAAIATYADATFDGPALQPRDPAGRARMHQWISAYNDNGAPSLVTVIVQRLVMDPPDEDLVAEKLPQARRALEVFDGALAGSDWLAGDALTLADLFLAPPLFYLPMIPEGAALLDGLGNLERWYGAVSARPSFAATMPEMPDAA